MQIRFSGDFASLQEFAKRVRQTPDVLQTVNEQLAEEAVELVRGCYETATDPYGKPWARLKLRDGTPLSDTGGEKASWHRESASRTGFTIASAKKTTIRHLRGTGLYGPHATRIYPTKARALKLPGGIFVRSTAGEPQRKMVPDQGLPARWRDRFVETAQQVLSESFRR